jgi:hypothetical protein
MFFAPSSVIQFINVNQQNAHFSNVRRPWQPYCCGKWRGAKDVRNGGCSSENLSESVYCVKDHKYVKKY